MISPSTPDGVRLPVSGERRLPVPLTAGAPNPPGKVADRLISGLLVAMPGYRFVHVARFYVLLAALLEMGRISLLVVIAQTFTTGAISQH